ncbi:AsnC family transcriptional regulator [Bordetella sp. J329]|jgi:Lrp/AsnC family leucine-responsive transcriptional regulator|uniref:Lrp/AsnC family transcriptional regulator n=1 Tax=Kerstersia gyiorum TaxID=206506 RepID=UPI000FDC3F28|nr:Lrp/AsnC family transcriptional regulator [Kerstersia gyiorum]AZV92589.1 AsnC family transcriptional regulator [Bordetella sp. J329]MCH4271923.1 Lrp/AsnC family transcriptional regulator [Kerstersia gyiorum]MCI1229457.1 Lrp/AsnC family transcriptional regulator [Kerstersia gyiorum]
MQLDKADLGILRLLQENARSSFDVLAAEVGLSSSAVLRRVKRLESEGLIKGYRAVINAEAAGIGLMAYVNVRLEKQVGAAQVGPKEMFQVSVQSWPEVVECVSLTGEMDFLLRVAVRDMNHFSRFISDKVLHHESVRDCRSSFVMEWVKENNGLPLEEA